ncbi:MAG: hypothetical protein U0640_07955 [Phycisphaerales bacterium]
MNPRSILALGVGGLAAVAAVVFGVTKQVGVKSYGYPVGRVVRTGQHLSVLIETRNPYMPSLKGRPESDMSYSYSLWLIPETGDGDINTVRLDRSVRSGDRMHTAGVHGFDNGVVWCGIKNMVGVDIATSRVVDKTVPAAIDKLTISDLLVERDSPLADYKADSVALPSGDWLFLADDEETQKELTPGTRLYDNSPAKRSFLNRKPRFVTVQEGPIPRVATANIAGTAEFKNGAFMRSTKNGKVIKFTNPEGFLIVHEAGVPGKPSVHFSRLNIDGSVAWTVDTKIGTFTQILPHDTLPAFVGQLPGELTEPTLTVVNLKDGTAKTKSLVGPLN